MALTQIKPAGLSKPVDLADNEKIRLGTGNDLEIYHTGSQSRIENSGTGELRIQADDIQITDKEANDFHIKCVHDGAVELYHDNAKRFETTSSGAKIENTVSNTSAQLEINATNGGQPTILLKSSLSGTNRATRIDFLNQDSTTPKWTLINDFNQGGANDFRITNTASSSQSALRAVNNGAVELYHAGNLKAATYSDGLSVTGNILCGGGIINSTAGNAHIVLDSGTGSAAGNQLSFIDFKHNGTVKANIACTEVSSGNPSLDLNGAGAGQTKIYDSGNLKLYTYTNGVFVLGNLGVGDHTAAVSWENVIYAGASMDLQIKHDSNNSIIENYTGDLYVQNTSINENGHLYLRAKGGEHSIACYNDAGVHLYHDGTQKLSTTANGICFNADSAAANALDDYEEGTFSPVIGAHNTTTGQQTGNGFYTKVGNRVHMNISFNNVNTGSVPNGAVIRISSLPFAVVGVAGEYVTATTLMTYGNVLKPYTTFYTDNGNAWATGIYASEIGGQWANTPSDDFNNGTMYLNFALTHRTS